MAPGHHRIPDDVGDLVEDDCNFSQPQTVIVVGAGAAGIDLSWTS